MKTFKVSATALLIVLSTIPAIAADKQPPGQKNLCLLYSEDCPDRKDDILQIIAKLRAEIARGAEVYTPEELRRLENKLEDYEYLLYALLYHNTD